MNLTINIYYTGKNGSARRFVSEMLQSGIADRVRAEDGNEKYDYYFPADDEETVLLIDRWRDKAALDRHHKSEMMKQIASLRDKYQLKMRVEQYTDAANAGTDFETVIRDRTATRKFKSDEVDSRLLERILEAGRLAPTAKNLQPQKIYVARTAEALAKIDLVSPCRYGAPTVLIVCSDKNIAWSSENFSSCGMDACIVATHMMLEATNVGVDNIWIEMFDKAELKQQFALPDHIMPVCLIPIGFKTDDYTVGAMHGKRKALQETVEFI